MQRIVVTGLGIVSSIGIGKEAFWNALLAGKSGLSKITAFDTSNFANHYGGEVKAFVPEKFMDGNQLKRMGRTSQMAIAAAKMALEDAGLRDEVIVPSKVGVCIGTTNGEIQVLEEIVKRSFGTEAFQVDNRLVSMIPNSVIPLHVAAEFGFYGPNSVIPTACAAGNYAIAFSYDNIILNRADVMLAGGVDSMCWITFVGFNRLAAVAPEKCQPFDKNRKGILTAEGAGMVVLESMDRAQKRGAHIYAEIKGYGLSCDAFHMTKPCPDGVVRAMEDALNHAQVGKKEIDYINAHGTGTPANDKSESAAIKQVFGDDYKKVPVSSIKSMLGHSMGAASAIEAITTILAVKHDAIPPTMNYETPDPECDIDCVPNEARQLKVNIAINNSFAFGGNNSCLVVGKV